MPNQPTRSAKSVRHKFSIHFSSLYLYTSTDYFKASLTLR
ncbi:Uncharacterised protein [Vibrio cholerae]|nr:Uncharacterised protein [Vibrio cholerae]